MPNVKIRINDKIETVETEDLFRNRRVLLFSIAVPVHRISFYYVQHVLDNLSFYKEMGIDEVYAVCTNYGLMPILQYERRFPQLTILCDTDSELINDLQSRLDKDSINNWSYQILLNNNELEHFEDQPTSNYFRELMKSNRVEHRVVNALKKYMAQDEQLILNSPVIVKLDNDVLQKLYYFNLWPNKSLQDHLRSRSHVMQCNPPPQKCLFFHSA
jgi:peroxiredoxin